MGTTSAWSRFNSSANYYMMFKSCNKVQRQVEQHGFEKISKEFAACGSYFRTAHSTMNASEYAGI